MDTNSTEIPNESGLGSYALSGKVMLCSVIILFLVVILVISFHFYARMLVQRTRRRRLRHHQLPLNGRTANNSYHLSIFTQGLDPSVLISLPTFVYKPDTHPKAMDCAVCLSDFEENETGRTLPKCGHSFHFDCIDMWFQSHSNCPLCRAPVREAESYFPMVQNPSEVIVSVTEIESRSGSDLDCNRNDGSVSSPSGGCMPEERPRKSLDFVDIVVRSPPAEVDDQERNGSGIGANGDCDSDSRIPLDKSLTSL